MNIQFFHKRSVTKYVLEIGDINSMKTYLSAKGGTTIALQVPTIQEFDAFQITEKDHWGDFIHQLN